MRLLEAIMEANQRYAKGEPLKAEDYGEALPLVVLTCIDPRINRLVPEALGLPDEQFIWLRNAGNIITGPLSSTRSPARARSRPGGVPDSSNSPSALTERCSGPR